MEYKNEDMIRSMQEAISEKLEQMAYLEVTDPEDDLEGASNLLWTKIDIKEPVHVALTMVLPDIVAFEITNSIFSGMNQSPTDDLINDTLGELSNTIAGRLMNKIISKDVLSPNVL